MRETLISTLAPLSGCVRVTLGGEVAPSLELDLRDLAQVGEHLDGLVLRSAVSTGYDLERISGEPTIRGQFVRDALRDVEDPRLRQRVILAGLRALDGRNDLEVA